MSSITSSSLAIAASRLSLALVIVTQLTGFGGAAMAGTSNKEKIRLFYDAFETADPALLDQVLAPDWVDVPMNPGQGPGRDGFKPLLPKFKEVFANTRMTNEDIIEEGDKVVVRSTYTATQAGPFAGFPSKGRDFEIMTIDIHQFNDQGLVVKTWHLEDWLGGLFQMGAFDQN